MPLYLAEIENPEDAHSRYTITFEDKVISGFLFFNFYWHPSNVSLTQGQILEWRFPVGYGVPKIHAKIQVIEINGHKIKTIVLSQEEAAGFYKMTAQ